MVAGRSKPIILATGRRACIETCTGFAGHDTWVEYRVVYEANGCRLAILCETEEEAYDLWRKLEKAMGIELCQDP